MKNVWTAYYNNQEYTHFKNGQEASLNFASKGRSKSNGWTLRDDLGILIDDEDIAYMADYYKREARRVSREEADEAWLNKNSHYTSGMYDNEDCYD